MAKESKLLILVGGVLAALLVALVTLGSRYYLLGTLLLPLGLWLSVRREPEQAKARPAIRTLGWLFVGVAAVAIVAGVFAIWDG